MADHDHGHTHSHSPIGRLNVPFLHGHSHGETPIDQAMETSQRGIWAVKLSFAGLFITALFQFIIVLISGSTGLLADTIHNVSDAFTAVPLWLAFSWGRRPATHRYTYGFGRAEDIAGAIIVLMIFISSIAAGYESITRLLHPEPLQHPWWVMAAAMVGFLGNEGVAGFRIRVGQQIGSAALVADGHHARVDGLTSLAVVFGAIGSLLGLHFVDPLIGILITITILFIVKDTAALIWARLMDAVDPNLTQQVAHIASTIPGIHGVHAVRLRWIGHALHTELELLLAEDLPLSQSQQIAHQVRHALLAQHLNLTTVLVQFDADHHHDHTHPHIT